MNKKLLLLFMHLCLYGFSLMAQKAKNNITDTAKLLIDSTTFSSIINREFTQLVNGESKALIGSFAALDLKDSKVSFNGSWVSPKLKTITLNASGSADGGTYAIFNNSKLNSNISLELKFSSIFNKSSRLRSYLSEIEARKQNIERIDSLYAIKKRSVQTQINFIDLTIESLQYEIKNIITDTALSDKQKSLKILEKKVKIDSLNILKYSDFGNAKLKTRSVQAEYKKVRKAAETDFNITGIRMHWIAFSYKILNKSFTLFNPSAAADKQTSKANFTAHYVTIDLNFYQWSNRPGESWYVQAGAGFSYDDNKDDLLKTELTETKEYGTTGNSRTSTKKYFVYTGDYKDKKAGIRFFADAYWFLLKNNVAAVHLFPAVSFRNKEKPLYSCGGGFMYSFKDKKDDKGKALINAELYYKLTDITNSRNFDKSLFERNEIGLRFGLPLKFFFND